MTDPQRLADAIDPRKNAFQFIVGDPAVMEPARLLVLQADLIAASDALRSSATALEIGRAMGREEAAKVCEELAGEYGNHPQTLGVARDAIRSAAPEIDMEALVEKVAKAAFYSGATDRAWDDCRAPEGWRRMARAVLATIGLTARQQEK